MGRLVVSSISFCSVHLQERYSSSTRGLGVGSPPVLAIPSVLSTLLVRDGYYGMHLTEYDGQTGRSQPWLTHTGNRKSSGAGGVCSCAPTAAAVAPPPPPAAHPPPAAVVCRGDPPCHRGAVGARPRRRQWGLNSIPCCMQCRTEHSGSSEHRAPGPSTFHCDAPPQCRQRPQLCLKSQHLSM